MQHLDAYDTGMPVYRPLITAAGAAVWIALTAGALHLLQIHSSAMFYAVLFSTAVVSGLAMFAFWGHKGAAAEHTLGDAFAVALIILGLQAFAVLTLATEPLLWGDDGLLQRALDAIAPALALQVGEASANKSLALFLIALLLPAGAVRLFFRVARHVP